MTEKPKKNLRVFCLCGQKMQVTAEMYGKPAKCVSCHQKWFIPEKSEIPKETESISLKDHPELLRMPGQLSRSLDGIGENAGEMKRYFKSTPQPITEINIGVCLEKEKDSTSDCEEAEPQPIESTSENVSSSANGVSPDVIMSVTPKIPLTPLEPLRLLFAYEEELKKRKEAIRLKGGNAEDNGLSRYEIALDNAKTRLYTILRREQQSKTKQITVLEEEIARLNVALRVGDCSLSLYLSQTDDLRKSRENLIRRNHDLMAWQEIKEPALAGDMISVSLDTFNENSFEIHLPDTRQVAVDKPLYVGYGDELRGLFEIRAALERRQTEWKKMAAENDFSAASVQEGLVETEAALTRNMACIHFCQQRMEQIVLDCDNDLKALVKYKEEVFERAVKKQLRENNLKEVMDEIEQAEERILRMRGLARQALTANSPTEVPAPSTTIMQRLRSSIGTNTYAVDSVLFLAAAFLTILGLLMFTDTVSSGTDWLAVLSTCIVAGIATLGFIMDRNLRAPIILLLWMLLLAIMAIFVYQRTAMDKYLIFWNTENTFPIPLINVRAWFIVLGAAFAGAGAGISLLNYLHNIKRSLRNMPAMIVIFTIFSGGAIAATHTIAPRTAPLVIESVSTTTATETQNESPDSRNVAINNNSNATGGQIPFVESTAATDDNAYTENGNDPVFLMQGVIHSEGSEPLFKASLSYPDGSVKDISLKLGDVILGDWTAKEYNQYTKKLTISNGERLLILEAGRQVPLIL